MSETGYYSDSRKKPGPEYYFGVFDPYGSGKFIHVGYTTSLPWQSIIRLFYNKNAPLDILYNWRLSIMRDYPGGLYVPKEMIEVYNHTIKYTKPEREAEVYVRATPEGKFGIPWRILTMAWDETGDRYLKDIKWKIMAQLRDQDVLLDLKEWANIHGIGGNHA